MNPSASAPRGLRLLLLASVLALPLAGADAIDAGLPDGISLSLGPLGVVAGPPREATPGSGAADGDPAPLSPLGIDVSVAAPLLGEATLAFSGPSVAVAGPRAQAAAESSLRDGMTESLARAVEVVAAEGPRAGVLAVLAAAVLERLGALRWAFAGVFALYSRIARNDLLDQERRSRIFDLVKERPGIGMSEIQASLGIGWGTTVHHLEKLERAGMLASERTGTSRRFFAVGAVRADERAAFAALARPAHEELVREIASRPGLAQKDLASSLELAPSVVTKSLAKLEACGLVRRVRDGRVVRCYPGALAPSSPTAARAFEGAPATPATG